MTATVIVRMKAVLLMERAMLISVDIADKNVIEHILYLITVPLR